MQVSSPKRRCFVRTSGAALVSALILVLFSSTAWAWPSCADDSRASAIHIGNPKSCWAIGLRGDTRVGSNSNLGAGDVNVAGTVKTNEGVVEPGMGQEVDITITGPSNVVVDAVVVDSGNRHNTYRSLKFLPPTLAPDQHYIPPFNIIHRVPTIQYWFACYHVDPATTLPDVPRVLEVPLAGGAVFAAWLFVHRRRRKESPAS
jgi:hypothetical protein